MVGDVGEELVEEQAPISSAQEIRQAVKGIDPSRSKTLARTRLFVIDIPSVSKAKTNGENFRRGKKSLE